MLLWPWNRCGREGNQMTLSVAAWKDTRVKKLTVAPGKARECAKVPNPEGQGSQNQAWPMLCFRRTT